MKAARLEDGQLHIREVPTPEPAFEEARIRISASGVCHSDLHIVRGDWAGVPLTTARIAALASPVGRAPSAKARR